MFTLYGKLIDIHKTKTLRECPAREELRYFLIKSCSLALVVRHASCCVRQMNVSLVIDGSTRKRHRDECGAIRFPSFEISRDARHTAILTSEQSEKWSDYNLARVQIVWALKVARSLTYSRAEWQSEKEIIMADNCEEKRTRRRMRGTRFVIWTAIPRFITRTAICLLDV